MTYEEYNREVERRYEELRKAHRCLAGEAIGFIALFMAGLALIWLCSATRPPRPTAEQVDRELNRRAAAYQASHPGEDYVEVAR